MKVLARGLLAALVWMAVLPAVAGAHATIVRVTPADRSVVAKQPRAVTIRWSEPVELGPDSVRLLDATGATIDTPKAVHSGGDRATAVLKLPAGLEQGTYVVAWRITSADSHPVSGAFSFSVGQPSALVTAGAPGAASGVVKAVDGIARGLSFVGLRAGRRRRVRAAAPVAAGQGEPARAAVPRGRRRRADARLGRAAVAAGALHHRRRAARRLQALAAALLALDGLRPGAAWPGSC